MLRRDILVVYGVCVTLALEIDNTTLISGQKSVNISHQIDPSGPFWPHFDCFDLARSAPRRPFGPLVSGRS